LFLKNTCGALGEARGPFKVPCAFAYSERARGQFCPLLRPSIKQLCV